MGLLDSITSSLSRFLLDLVDRLIGPAALKLVTKITGIFTHITTLGSTLTDIISHVKSEVIEWRNFRENIKVKSRVINVPRAWDQTEAFIVGFKDSWNAIIDIIKEFKSKLNTSTAEADAAEASADIEEGGAGTLLKRLPALAKGLEKVLGVATLIFDALESIASVFDDINTLLDEATRIREEIEGAESLFLSQNNPRRRVTLQDGSTMRIRVGNLHN